MYENCLAQMQMQRVFLEDGFYDGASYVCKIIRYQPEKNRIYLLTGKTELTCFSLDAMYRCTISAAEEEVSCYGILKERYAGHLGKILVLDIHRGFYKNPVN